jgi:serine acetyltransferase
MANGTSVTIGNRAKTPVLGQVTLACGNRIAASADVNKVFPKNVPE